MSEQMTGFVEPCLSIISQTGMLKDEVHQN
jgi:hypothetical protein